MSCQFLPNGKAGFEHSSPTPFQQKHSKFLKSTYFAAFDIAEMRISKSCLTDFVLKQENKKDPSIHCYKH